MRTPAHVEWMQAAAQPATEFVREIMAVCHRDWRCRARQRHLQWQVRPLQPGRHLHPHLQPLHRRLWQRRQGLRRTSPEKRAGTPQPLRHCLPDNRRGFAAAGLAGGAEGFAPEKLLARRFRRRADRQATFTTGCGLAKADAMFEVTSLNATTGAASDRLTSRAALEAGAHAISANKGPVVHAYRELTDLAAAKELGGSCLSRP